MKKQEGNRRLRRLLPRRTGRALPARQSTWPPVLESPQPERPAGARLPDAERVRSLARHVQSESVAFQSVAAAALRVLVRVLVHERQVAAAAISLAQREKLQQMVQSLEQIVQALRESLSTQGQQMLDLSEPPVAESPDERSWWFTLTEAIHVLEEGRDWLASAVRGQPKGSAARTLSSILTRLLHRHHNALLAEADRWIS